MRVRQSQGDGSSGSLRTSNATRLQSALSKPLRCGHSIAAGVRCAASRCGENTRIAESIGTGRVTDTRPIYMLMETTDGTAYIYRSTSLEKSGVTRVG